MAKKKGLKRGSPEYKKKIDEIQAKRDQEDADQRHMARQMAMDAAAIVLHRLWNFGPTRQVKFHDAWEEVMNDIAEMFNEDAKQDKFAIFSKDTLDSELLKAVGAENFTPYEERYAL